MPTQTPQTPTSMHAGIQAILKANNYTPPTKPGAAPAPRWQDLVTNTAPAQTPAPAEDPTQTLGADDAKEVLAGAEDAADAASTAQQRAAQHQIIPGSGTSITDAAKAEADKTGDVLEAIPGVLAGGIRSVFAPLTATIQKLSQTASDNPEVQKFAMSSPVSALLDSANNAEHPLNQWAAANPRAAKDLQNVLTIGLTAAGGAEADPLLNADLGETATGLKNTATDAIGKPPGPDGGGGSGIRGALANAKDSLTSPMEDTNASVQEPRTFKQTVAQTLYGKDQAKLTQTLADTYRKIPVPKGVLQEEAATGKSFADFMASKPDISIPVKDGKFDTWNTAQKLRAEAAPEAQALSSLLENQSARISETSIISQMKDSVKKVATGQERQGVQDFIDREVPTLVDQFSKNSYEGPDGDRMVSVANWNDIKQALWDRSPFKPTASRADNLKSSVDYAMGKVIKGNIEKAVPDADVQQLNSELGDYYHSIETLENLHGGPAPKGRLGLDFARLAGTVVGSPGGIIGSVAGYMSAEKVAQFLMSPELTTSLKREALTQLKTARPTVASQVADILKKQASEQATRLKLPASNVIYAGPGKGVTTPADQAVFERNAAGIKTESPKQQLHFYLDILGRD